METFAGQRETLAGELVWADRALGIDDLAGEPRPDGVVLALADGSALRFVPEGINSQFEFCEVELDSLAALTPVPPTISVIRVALLGYFDAVEGCAMTLDYGGDPRELALHGDNSWGFEVAIVGAGFTLRPEVPGRDLSGFEFMPNELPEGEWEWDSGVVDLLSARDAEQLEGGARLGLICDGGRKVQTIGEQGQQNWWRRDEPIPGCAPELIGPLAGWSSLFSYLDGADTHLWASKGTIDGGTTYFRLRPVDGGIDIRETPVATWAMRPGPEE